MAACLRFTVFSFSEIAVTPCWGETANLFYLLDKIYLSSLANSRSARQILIARIRIVRSLMLSPPILKKDQAAI